MKVFIYAQKTEIWDTFVEKLRSEFPNDQFPYGNEENLVQEHLHDCDCIVSGRLSDDELVTAGNLRVIFVPWTGVDTLNLDMIKEMNISVSNSHASAPYVAERAVGLALALLGKITHFDRSLRNGYWHRAEFWESLNEMNCGLLGAGNIGKNIAKLVKPFGASVTAFSRSLTSEKFEYFDKMEFDFENFLQETRLLFVSLPITKKTTHIINNENLKIFGSGYIVNVGRGGLIEEESLYNSLLNGELTGAALDTWFIYPRGKTQPVMPSQFPFHELDNIVMSPHAASHTYKARYANILETYRNIKYFLENHKVRNEIVFDRGY